MISDNDLALIKGFHVVYDEESAEYKRPLPEDDEELVKEEEEEETKAKLSLSSTAVNDGSVRPFVTYRSIRLSASKRSSRSRL